MSLHTVLSVSIGVPAALLAMVLLFRLDADRVRSSPTPRILNASAAGATALLVVLVVARFVNYA